MHRKVLGSRDHAVVARIVALHALHKGHAHARGQERIFAVSLLPAAPARIAEDVHVRRPEIQPLKDLAEPAILFHKHVVLDAGLNTDGYRHLVDRSRIERRGQCDWLGILRNPLRSHAVQRLAPPVVGRHVQPLNGTRLIHQLGCLLFQRHPAHKVGGALLGRQARIHIRRLLGLLRTNRPQSCAAQQRRCQHPHSRFSHCFPRARRLSAQVQNVRNFRTALRSKTKLRQKPLSSPTKVSDSLMENRFMFHSRTPAKYPPRKVLSGAFQVLSGAPPALEGCDTH